MKFFLKKRTNRSVDIDDDDDSVVIAQGCELSQERKNNRGSNIIRHANEELHEGKCNPVFRDFSNITTDNDDDDDDDDSNDEEEEDIIDTSPIGTVVPRSKVLQEVKVYPNNKNSNKTKSSIIDLIKKLNCSAAASENNNDENNYLPQKIGNTIGRNSQRGSYLLNQQILNSPQQKLWDSSLLSSRRIRKMGSTSNKIGDTDLEQSAGEQLPFHHHHQQQQQLTSSTTGNINTAAVGTAYHDTVADAVKMRTGPLTVAQQELIARRRKKRWKRGMERAMQHNNETRGWGNHTGTRRTTRKSGHGGGSNNNNNNNNKEDVCYNRSSDGDGDGDGDRYDYEVDDHSSLSDGGASTNDLSLNTRSSIGDEDDDDDWNWTDVDFNNDPRYVVDSVAEDLGVIATFLVQDGYTCVRTAVDITKETIMGSSEKENIISAKKKTRQKQHKASCSSLTPSSSASLSTSQLESC